MTRVNLNCSGPAMAPKIYVVRGDCSDYYCGCGGGHLLGVASTEAGAAELAEQAKGRTRLGVGTSLDYGPFYRDSIRIEGPLTVDALVDEAFLVR